MLWQDYYTHNIGVLTIFVKASDTTLWQAAVLLFSFISTGYGEINLTLHGLAEFLGSCILAGITVTELVIGSAGAVLLLVITAPSVGYEWPPAVPGWIEGDQIIIIVEGSYGQGHIIDRSQSQKKCVASSHQAIVDNPYKIVTIVKNALKLLYNKGQYVYYYVEGGKEWAVFIEEYENKYYELRTAYRADCSPFVCKDMDGNIHEFPTILEKWICEGFQIISMW